MEMTKNGVPMISKNGSPAGQENVATESDLNFVNIEENGNNPDFIHIEVTTPPTLDFLSKIPEKSCEESTKIPKRVADVAFQATDGTDGIDSASIANKGKRSVVRGGAHKDEIIKSYHAENPQAPLALIPREVGRKVYLQAYPITTQAATGEVSAVSVAAPAPAPQVEATPVRSIYVTGQTSSARSAVVDSMEEIRRQKLERRKQANRDSARRSRMRRAAELEEYAYLKKENEALKSLFKELAESRARCCCNSLVEGQGENEIAEEKQAEEEVEKE